MQMCPRTVSASEGNISKRHQPSPPFACQAAEKSQKNISHQDYISHMGGTWFLRHTKRNVGNTFLGASGLLTPWEGAMRILTLWSTLLYPFRRFQHTVCFSLAKWKFYPNAWRSRGTMYPVYCTSRNEIFALDFVRLRGWPFSGIRRVPSPRSWPLGIFAHLKQTSGSISWRRKVQICSWLPTFSKR